jgi:hypothetical protein
MTSIASFENPFAFRLASEGERSLSGGHRLIVLQKQLSAILARLVKGKPFTIYAIMTLE